MGSLSDRLGELDQLDNLDGAVPCEHPHCRFLVKNIDGKRYRHVNTTTGKLLAEVMDVYPDDSEPAWVPHTAAPRTPKGQGR